MEFINKELLNNKRIKELERRFLEGEPYEHIFIEGFLDRGFARRIFESLKKERFERKESDLFSFSQTNDFAGIEKGILKEFYEFMKSKEFIKWLEKIVGIKLRGGIDISASLYKRCDYLLCHDDRLKKRKIAFIYYLTNYSHGGELIMYNSYGKNVGNEAKRILPKFNSILFFKVSKNSFHSVNEVLKGNRYAIGGWFH